MMQVPESHLLTEVKLYPRIYHLLNVWNDWNVWVSWFTCVMARFLPHSTHLFETPVSSAHLLRLSPPALIFLPA